MRRFLGSRPALGRWAIGLLAVALVATGVLLWSRWQESLRWKLAEELRRAFAARDVAAVERLFAQWPQARILWAHSGFEPPARVREVLRRHPRLWCDLAFRSDQASGGKVDGAWHEAFVEFPDRFMVGTDTFTPERWHYVGPHARWSREWLADLPAPLAEAIAWRNGQALLQGLWKA